MNSYDIDLNMDIKNSASMIVNMVKPESTVLEFGCAHGRMTKYLKENKNCNVFIIEINKTAYDDAIKYAYAGFCGDIEQFEWRKSLADETFDHIIFADVLEHLYHPEQVLTTITALLKDTGSVLLSVPNVAHSAIIISLINNRFDYKFEGLLDNTHIRFFTYYTLKEMLVRCGLTSIEEYSTDLLPWHSEFKDDIIGISDNVINNSLDKDFGSTYQFIFQCMKTECITTVHEAKNALYAIPKRIPYECLKLYYSETGNFCEDKTIRKEILLGENDISIFLTKIETANFLRMDITEKRCAIKLHQLTLDDVEYDVRSISGNFDTQNKNCFVFLNDDPSFLIYPTSPPQKMNVRFFVQNIADNDILNQNILAQSEYAQRLAGEITLLSEQNIKSSHELAEISDRNTQLSRELTESFERSTQLSHELTETSARNTQLSRELIETFERNTQLSHELTETLEQNARLSRELIDSNKRIEALENRLRMLELNYSNIINSRSWKMTYPLRKLMVFIKFLNSSRREISIPNNMIYALDVCKFENDILTIAGWIFHSDEELKNIEIQLLFSKKTVSFPIPYGIERKDVAAEYSNRNAFYSGFTAELLVRNTTRFDVALHYSTLNLTGSISIARIRKSPIAKLRYIKTKVSLAKIKKGLSLITHGHFDIIARVLSEPLVETISHLKTFSVNLPKWIATNWSNEVPSYSPELYKCKVDIIIPVYNGRQHIHRLFTTLSKTHMTYRLIIIDDCSPDVKILPLLNELVAKHPNSILIENKANLGFVKTVNKGFQIAENHVALLNTDIELPEHWLERLITPLILDESVASSTPFTNSGTLCSFPITGKNNSPFLGLTCDEIDKMFCKIKPSYAELPTGVGFCMGISINALKNVGLFDAHTFTRGYGEENDWCQRAILKGYKNVIVDNLFVYHKHGGSFENAEKKRLIETNSRNLLTKHPNYNTDIARFFEQDPLFPLRNVVALFLCESRSKGTSLFFDHNIGGGATAYLNKAKVSLLREGKSVIVIRYDVITQRYLFIYNYGDMEIDFDISPIQDIQNIIILFSINEIFINNLVTYPNLYQLLALISKIKEITDIRLTYLLHDYFCACPTINLLNNSNTFCNLVNTKYCNNCLATNSFLGYESFESIEKWKERWLQFLNVCDRIVAFSYSSKELFNKWYGHSFDIEVQPHKVQYLFAVPRQLKRSHSLNIGLLGHLSNHKGLSVIEEMLRITDKEETDMRFILLGESDIEIKSRHFLCHGQYHPESLPKLALQYDIDVFLIPSIWPETFSYTTEEAMAMEYPVAVFDIGAPAERVTHYAKGLIIPNVDARCAFDTLTTFWSEFPYKPTIVQKPLRVVFLTEYESFSSRYRVDHFMEKLLFFEFSCKYFNTSDIQTICLDEFDAAVIYRSIRTKHLEFFISKCHSMKIPVFYDIDDYIFDFDKIKMIDFILNANNDKFEKYSRGIRDCLSLCDGCFTSTENLKTAIHNTFPGMPVVVNRNTASMEMLSLSLKTLCDCTHENERVVMGYFSGSDTHNKDFTVIQDCIVALMKNYDNLYLKIVGVLQLDDCFAEFEDRIITVAFMDWRKLPEHIATIDINLMPLEDTFFHACKSENKWIEAALVCVPTVASKTDEFAAIIEDGVTGFLCDKDQWRQTLKNLINSPALRKRIGKTAHHKVLSCCTTMNSNGNAVQYLKNRIML
jgi:GT2 family glycosyltransferase/glycosyltransferase involved in cell wall biosynthesis/2-polyprenyl-3-methyl-5-hydroxy-6-metoxy-1,4-benzoquinol methylase